MTYALGQTVELSFTTDPAETGTIVVARPDETTFSPGITGVAGAQLALVDADQNGTWSYVWTAPNAGAQPGSFVVGPGSGVTLANVKAALNKTDTGDDPELLRFIAAAEAEYANRVGPLPGTVTQIGYGPVIVLGSSFPALLVSVKNADGIEVSATIGGAGIVTTGSTDAVTVVYTVGALPANHVETIVADIAGYFAQTQRGSNVGALPGGYESAYEDRQRPVVMFPRIAALASSGIA